ncbi:MAG TPA: hypothetical protein VJR94_08940 [Candidatus Nitrosocosmicus sp.]|nr:hypothetical protein [Candidatus Nitrosocosmicus sp.]
MSIEGENVREEEDVQDKTVEKIHKEEGLDEEDNNYNVSEAQGDSNQQDAEKDSTGT